MPSHLRPALASLTFIALGFSLGVAAESPGSAAKAPAPAGKAPVTSAASRAGTTARGSTAKGPLPDPALLDGSTLPVEKRPEHGMVGDFELPGDENARSGKVGGPQNPN